MEERNHWKKEREKEKAVGWFPPAKCQNLHWLNHFFYICKLMCNNLRCPAGFVLHAFIFTLYYDKKV